MRYHVSFGGGREVAIDVGQSPTGELWVEVEGRRVEVDATVQAGSITLRIDGRIVDLHLEGTPPEVGVVAGPYRFYASVESDRMRALAAALGAKPSSSEGIVRSPMPGRVLKVLVGEGDRVEPGMPLVVVEAMKMENELCAGKGGTVAKVCVAPGANVEGGAPLVEIA